ncbi:hypothetical protein JOD45_002753 [Scopulibacillus daqui]|uniref:HSP20 family molecular chaperone IbpA n=1 Tax=Scopulibacillus daqui TaxID=1469162 RepID=A0ABS2Q2S8_9BACL|nr:hypothetical protein [Scopulibacillus daqui]MBM7646523.1 hypothetical protein [Scopulibacillus daqui]
MFPFSNPNDLQTYIDNMKQPFMQGFPFNGADIQKMVNDSIQQAFPDFLKNQRNEPDSQNQRFNRSAGTSGQQSASHDYQVFETHDFVIARIPIDRIDGRIQPRIYMDTYHLYVKGLPDDPDDLKIPLPSPVRPKFAKAEYKSNILEIRMLKKGPEPLTEISVDES